MARVEPLEATVATSQPTHPGWRRNLAFIWIGVFVGLLGANFVFPFMAFFIKELGVTEKSRISYFTGISASVTGLSLMLTAPVWGAMADRYGRKAMFIRALVGAGIVIGVMGVVQEVWQFIALRFVLGGFAGTMGAAAALVASSTPRERLGYSLGLLQTGQFTANMLGPFVGGVVAAGLGIRESFIFCASLYLLAAALAWVFVRESKAAPHHPVAEHRPRGGGLLYNLRTVVSDRQTVVLLGFLFGLWLSTSFVRPVMPISIDDFAEHGATSDDDRVTLQLPGGSVRLKEEAATGLVFGVIGLTSTIAALSVAPLGERFGYRRCVVGAAVLTGVLYLPVAAAGSYTAFVLLFASVGLFQGAMVPGTNALIAVAVPDGMQGSAFGVAASVQSAASFVGPLAGGFVSGAFGISAVYLVIGLLLIVAALSGYPLLQERRIRVAEAA